MASRYDMLLADAANAATLYDADGVSNPRRVSVLISNASNLRNARNLSDYNDGVVAAGASIEAGQIIRTTAGWWIIAKVLDLSAVSFRAPPIKLLLLHLDDALAGTRGDQALTLRVMIREVKTKEGAHGTPDEEMTVLCPLGADVAINDLYTYAGWVWRVQDVTPALVDGHPYATEMRWDRYMPAAGNAADYIATNATVSCERNGQIVDAGRRVRLEYPKLEDIVMVGGVKVPTHLIDKPGADWQPKDGIIITEVDGQGATLPQVTRYGIRTINRLPAPQAMTDLELNA